MPHTLFVDDEPRILQGIRRTFRAHRKTLTTSFASSGTDALEHIRKDVPDVVISDMKMPVMDGARFLEEVSERAGHCVRFVLSGEAELEAIYRTVNVSHRFLSKPSKADDILLAVQRIMARKQALEVLSGREDLAAALASDGRLYANEAAQLTTLEAGTPDILAELALSTPGFALKLLQLTNSSYFSYSAIVLDAPSALTMLGGDVIARLTTNQQFVLPAEPAFAGPCKDAGDAARDLAIHTRHLASQMHADDTLIKAAHSAGLLFHVARFSPHALSSGINDEALPVIAAASAYLCELWGVPSMISDAIAHAVAPSTRPADSACSDMLLSCLHTALVQGGTMISPDPAYLLADATLSP